MLHERVVDHAHESPCVCLRFHRRHAVGVHAPHNHLEGRGGGRGGKLRKDKWRGGGRGGGRRKRGDTENNGGGIHLPRALQLFSQVPDLHARAQQRVRAARTRQRAHWRTCKKSMMPKYIVACIENCGVYEVCVKEEPSEASESPVDLRSLDLRSPVWLISASLKFQESKSSASASASSSS